MIVKLGVAFKGTARDARLQLLQVQSFIFNCFPFIKVQTVKILPRTLLDHSLGCSSVMLTPWCLVHLSLHLHKFLGKALINFFVRGKVNLCKIKCVEYRLHPG